MPASSSSSSSAITASARARLRRPEAVSSARMIRALAGSARRSTRARCSSDASTSIIDCGVISARRASCAFERHARPRSTESVVTSATLSSKDDSRSRSSRRMPWLTRPMT